FRLCHALASSALAGKTRPDHAGQEVVSRMQNRGTARRRVVTVSAATDLPGTGTEITAAGKPVGTLGSVDGGHGLAIVR
ncbi:hypothetical protein ACC754_43435, partial [Rhizobium johnstonii]